MGCDQASTITATSTLSKVERNPSPTDWVSRKDPPQKKLDEILPQGCREVTGHGTVRPFGSRLAVPSSSLLFSVLPPTQTSPPCQRWGAGDLLPANPCLTQAAAVFEPSPCFSAREHRPLGWAPKGDSPQFCRVRGKGAPARISLPPAPSSCALGSKE